LDLPERARSLRKIVETKSKSMDQSVQKPSLPRIPVELTDLNKNPHLKCLKREESGLDVDGAQLSRCGPLDEMAQASGSLLLIPRRNGTAFTIRSAASLQ
jgi:hypothetical protein